MIMVTVLSSGGAAIHPEPLVPYRRKTRFVDHEEPIFPPPHRPVVFFYEISNSKSDYKSIVWLEDENELHECCRPPLQLPDGGMGAGTTKNNCDGCKYFNCNRYRPDGRTVAVCGRLFALQGMKVQPVLKRLEVRACFITAESGPWG
ncbi:MAG: hypothetical protein JXP48_09475 [Acidobacteria bacterium]|nr:hypothetical protein [Acidobacteriota bacterium]